MQKTSVRNAALISFAALLMAFAFPFVSAAAPAQGQTLQELFQATQRMNYDEARERVFSGDGDPDMFVMTTDARDVVVVGNMRENFWVGRTNLREYPRIFGGAYGNFVWGVVAGAHGVPSAGAWFFGTRENGRFNIWNLFGNRAVGAWTSIQ